MSIDYYNKNAVEFFDNTVNVDMTGLYEKFTKHLPAGAKILDAGCGSGRDTKSFLAMGYQVEAFDASNEMVERASKHTGINVEIKTFNDITNHSSFDGIWCCASLLHVPQMDLVKTLENLGYALKEGGILYVSFKLGYGERKSDGRRFTDLNEVELNSVVNQTTNLLLFELWITSDQRPSKQEQSINALLKSKH